MASWGPIGKFLRGESSRANYLRNSFDLDRTKPDQAYQLALDNGASEEEALKAFVSSFDAVSAVPFEKAMPYAFQVQPRDLRHFAKHNQRIAYGAAAGTAAAAGITWYALAQKEPEPAAKSPVARDVLNEVVPVPELGAPAQPSAPAVAAPAPEGISPEQLMALMGPAR